MKKNEKECQRMQLFERVCIIYSKELQTFIYTLTRKDQFAAEEIYQNTMLGALKGLWHLRDNRKMKDWIFAIAKEESKRYYVKNNMVRAHEYHFIIEDIQADMDGLIDFTKSIEDKEFVERLINSLSDEAKQLYALHYYYGLPLKEISEILNLNYNTIRSMHTRGIAKMRKMIIEGIAV